MKINFIQKAIIVILIISYSSLFAQKQGQAKIDSLMLELPKAKEDTNKVNLLNEISKSSADMHPDEAIKYAQTAKELSIKLNYKKGIAYSLKSIGMAFYFHGKYVEAIDYWSQSLEIFKMISDNIGISNLASNLGVIYSEKGDDFKALDYYLQSLSIAEKIGDKLRIATALINIGVIYSNKKATLSKALEYYLKALPLSEEIGDKDALGLNCVNIGEVYLLQGDDKSALYYFEKALNTYKNNENVNLPYIYINLSKVYSNRKDYRKAWEYNSKALTISQHLDSKLQIIQSLIGLAYLKEKLKEHKLSIEKFKEAEIIAKEIGAKYELKNIWGELAKIYSNLLDYNNAYKYQTLFTDIKDTLYNIDTDKKLSGLQFNFDIQKKQAQIDLLEKDNKLREFELIRSKNERMALIGGIAFLILISIVIFRQRAKSEKLLLNVLPSKIAKRLKKKEHPIADNFDEASLVFIDIVEFTKNSANDNPKRVAETLNLIYSKLDHIAIKHGLEKIKTIGDCYMAAAGIPEPKENHAEAAAQFAVEAMQTLKNYDTGDGTKLNFRCGADCGPVVAGVIGDHKFIYDVWGDTVNIASRMEEYGEPGKIQVTERFKETIINYELGTSNKNDNYHFIERGEIEIKGKGRMKTYFLG